MDCQNFCFIYGLHRTYLRYNALFGTRNTISLQIPKYILARNQRLLMDFVYQKSRVVNHLSCSDKRTPLYHSVSLIARIYHTELQSNQKSKQNSFPIGKKSEILPQSRLKYALVPQAFTIHFCS